MKQRSITIMMEAQKKEVKNDKRVAVAYSTKEQLADIITEEKETLIKFMIEVFNSIEEDELVTIYSNVKSFNNLYLNKYRLDKEISEEVYNEAIEAYVSKVRNIIFSELKYSKEKEKADIALIKAKNKLLKDEPTQGGSTVVVNKANDKAIEILTKKLEDLLMEGDIDGAERITNMLSKLSSTNTVVKEEVKETKEENEKKDIEKIKEHLEKDDEEGLGETQRKALESWI